MKEKATAMLADNKVLEILREYGKVYIHGSYELDLMVWPEVDIIIYCRDFSTGIVWQALEKLHAVTPCKSAFFLNQCEHETRHAVPDIVVVDYHIIHNDIEWKLDLCFTDIAIRPWDDSYNRNLIERITPAQHTILRDIKTRAIESPGYRRNFWQYIDPSKHIYSGDLYHAVLDHDVKTYDEFVTFIRETRHIDLEPNKGK